MSFIFYYIKKAWSWFEWGTKLSPSVQIEGPKLRTDDERKAILSEFVLKQVSVGWHIELQEDFRAVLSKKPKTNHVVHFILSLLTAGFWLIIWLFIAIGSKTQTHTYRVDSYGVIDFL